jgi:hypothetical protein
MLQFPQGAVTTDRLHSPCHRRTAGLKSRWNRRATRGELVHIPAVAARGRLGIWERVVPSHRILVAPDTEHANVSWKLAVTSQVDIVTEAAIKPRILVVSSRAAFVTTISTQPGRTGLIECSNPFLAYLFQVSFAIPRMPFAADSSGRAAAPRRVMTAATGG